MLVLLIHIPATSVNAQFPQNPDQIVLDAEYRTSEPIVITGNQEFVTQNWTGSGTQLDPFVISGLNISFDFCISISDTTEWFVIRDCHLESNSSSGATIVLNNVTRGRIQNSFIGGEMTGIYLYNTENCVVRRNRIRGLVVGILLQNSMECTVRENIVHSCEVGIRLDNSVECDVIRNSAYANSETGIVATRFTRENTFYNNYVGYNAIDETGAHKNALDHGVENRWDDGFERGNNWSDYIINETYVIPGFSNAQDNYPSLFDDTSDSLLEGSSNLVFIVGSTGHIVEWNASEYFPVSYRMYLNNRLIDQGWWDSSKFLYNASILSIGVYNLTLSLYNGLGNYSVDQVFINVLEDIFSDIEAEYVLIASTLSVILVLAVLVVLRRYAR
jgi:parallel beta-helix repeat protein